MKKKLVIIVFVSLIVVVAFSVVISEVLKQSDPAPAEDAYGDYIDNNKISLQRTELDLSGISVTLSYDRTENMSESSRSDRFDDYGTYDVYCDDDMNEYYYLVDSSLLCGIFGFNNAPDDPEANPISEEKAIEYAGDFLSGLRTTTFYTFESAEYNDMGYYEIIYVYRVFNYKTDDVMRIWVTADGRICSYSEFMYMRYHSLALTATLQSEIALAKTSLETNIATAMSGVTYSIVGSYITYSDDGDLEVVYVVDIEKILSNDYSTTERELFWQFI